MGNRNGRDGPARDKGGRGRIGALTSTPSDQRPRERDSVYFDDSGTSGSRQTGEDPEGSSVLQDNRETEPGCTGIRPTSDSSPSRDAKTITIEWRLVESPPDSAIAVWESDREEDGHFSVQVRLVCQPDGGERAECVKWLAFGGDFLQPGSGGESGN